MSMTLLDAMILLEPWSKRLTPAKRLVPLPHPGVHGAPDPAVQTYQTVQSPPGARRTRCDRPTFLLKTKSDSLKPWCFLSNYEVRRYVCVRALGRLSLRVLSVLSRLSPGTNTRLARAVVCVWPLAWPGVARRPTDIARRSPASGWRRDKRACEVYVHAVPIMAPRRSGRCRGRSMRSRPMGRRGRWDRRSPPRIWGLHPRHATWTRWDVTRARRRVGARRSRRCA